MKKFLLFIIVFAAQAQIKSGPMVGFVDMMEAKIWVQTQKPQKVKLSYWETGATIKLASEEYATQKRDGFTATLTASDLEPGKTYQYEIIINGKKQIAAVPQNFSTQKLWQYRTDPPDFKVALGSCTYIAEEKFDRPGRPYGADYGIFETIAAQKPDLMLWSGDNTYYREPDYFSRTGMIYRMSHTRATAEMKGLLASTPNIAIWDDHDYGANDADRSFALKNDALDVFKMFWPNPNYIFSNEAVTGMYTLNDVQFFLMDDRWWKAPNELKETGNRDYWGAKQMSWLIDALKTSTAPFKIVVNGGQVVNPAKVFENMATYEKERETFLDLLAKEKIPGLIFISGDRHHTNLQKLERPGTYPLYDLCVSPLTSGPGKPVESEYLAKTIVEGTEVNNLRNFGLLSFSGKRTDRVMKISILDKDAKVFWTKEIKASELK